MPDHTAPEPDRKPEQVEAAMRRGLTKALRTPPTQHKAEPKRRASALHAH